MRDTKIKYCPICGRCFVDIVYKINETTIIRCDKCNHKLSIKEKDDGKEESKETGE